MAISSEYSLVEFKTPPLQGHFTSASSEWLSPSAQKSENASNDSSMDDTDSLHMPIGTGLHDQAINLAKQGQFAEALQRLEKIQSFTESANNPALYRALSVTADRVLDAMSTHSAEGAVGSSYAELTRTALGIVDHVDAMKFDANQEKLARTYQQDHDELRPNPFSAVA